jgi:hypothetical protein
MTCLQNTGINCFDHLPEGAACQCMQAGRAVRMSAGNGGYFFHVLPAQLKIKYLHIFDQMLY